MSTTQEDPERVQSYLRRIKEQESSPRPYILHFDSEAGDLRPWLWPTTATGERVSPDALSTFRAPGFRLPSCLCAVPGLDGVGVGYKESSIFLSLGEKDFGEYMAGCANRKCGYRVCCERSYDLPGLPLQWFHRAKLAPHPKRNAYPHRPQRLNNRAAKIQTRAPAAAESPFLKLIRLDSFSQPGLPESEFFDLFTRCRQCRWVMTRSAFQHHRCRVPQVVIDLTGDNND